MTSLKIGLVSPYGWNFAGGVHEHIRHLAAQLTQQGHHIHILAPALQTECTLHDGQIHNMGWSIPFPINNTTVSITLDPAAIWRLRSTFQRENFDIIHIHEPLLLGLPLLALRASHAVTIGTFHAYAEPDAWSIPALGYAALAPLLGSSFRKLDGRIAVSSAARQFIDRFFPADYHIIPNGVDLQRFNPANRPLPALMDGKQNILFVGRFDKRKGAKYLIQAIPAIRSLYPDTRFIFVGEGHLRQSLERFGRKQGYPEVLFTGYVAADMLPRYFASAHLFCAPATGNESMGIVLLEAMAAGIPIVASAIPGYRTVIDPRKEGLLTAPGNSNELANAIIHLLGDQALRQQCIASGLQKVRDYAWPLVAQRIVDYYMLLLQGKHAQNYNRMSIRTKA